MNFIHYITIYVFFDVDEKALNKESWILGDFRGDDATARAAAITLDAVAAAAAARKQQQMEEQND